MASTSRQWRTAELEALKEYDADIIVALYARIPRNSDEVRQERHVSFRCMIDAIVDAEESAADTEAISLVAS